MCTGNSAQYPSLCSRVPHSFTTLVLSWDLLLVPLFFFPLIPSGSAGGLPLGGRRNSAGGLVFPQSAVMSCGLSNATVSGDNSGVSKRPLELPREFSPSSVVTFVLFRKTQLILRQCTVFYNLGSTSLDLPFNFGMAITCPHNLVRLPSHPRLCLLQGH